MGPHCKLGYFSDMLKNVTIFIFSMIFLMSTFVATGNGAVIENIQALNTKCRDLFGCTIRKNCVAVHLHLFP